MKAEDVGGLLPFVEHGRSSCSDDNPSNGFSNYYRCLRCVLLDVQASGEWPEGLEVEVSMFSRPLVDDEL